MRAAGLLAVLTAAAAIGGCAHEVAGPEALIPTEKYGIQVTTHPQQIAIGLHRDGLSVTQRAALGQFVSQWREDGGGLVTVRLPADGADRRTAYRMQTEAMAYLVQLGVPHERLQVAGYAPGGAPNPPLLASYDRYEAQGPNCSGGWAKIAAGFKNGVYDHFGCAMAANTAAQVANPRDFLAPAVVTPADDVRREIVLGKYRNGQATATEKDAQADGKVSDSQ